MTFTECEAIFDIRGLQPSVRGAVVARMATIALRKRKRESK